MVIPIKQLRLKGKNDIHTKFLALTELQHYQTMTFDVKGVINLSKHGLVFSKNTIFLPFKLSGSLGLFCQQSLNTLAGALQNTIQNGTWIKTRSSHFSCPPFSSSSECFLCCFARLFQLWIQLVPLKQHSAQAYMHLEGNFVVSSAAAAAAAGAAGLLFPCSRREGRS